jgi:hypothetical protein
VDPIHFSSGSLGQCGLPLIHCSAGGLNGGEALCGNVAPNGAIALAGPQGQFKDMNGLTFHLKGSSHAGGVPDVMMTISSPQVKPIGHRLSYFQTE